MRAFAALILAASTTLPAAGAPARPYLDLGFEAPECTSGWWDAGRGPYEVFIDGSGARSGRQSLGIRYIGTQAWYEANGWFSVLGQDLPPALFAGKRVRFSGYIRTEGITEGQAELWFTAVNPDGSYVNVDMTGRGAAGTTPWTRYELEVTVPRGASEIYFGGDLVGPGAAWFDGFAIEIDGRPWTEKQPSYPPPSKAAVSWLRRQAIPFSTVEAGNGLDDLQPLKKLIGDARIVSLGEQTHGTREFFQMKHRLVEFLASEMGFTIFSIEANMPEAYKVNEYVLTGKGNPRELLKGMYFWTWDTQEVLDMIEWMRDFNASGKGRIEFTGFDMQFVKVANRIVREFLAKADPDFAREAEPLLRRVDATEGQTSVSAEDVAAARQVFQHLSGRRGDYLARFPRAEVDWAIQNARIPVQEVEKIAGITSRDSSMADNVDWILEQNPGAKVVLWAHNLHVTKYPGAMGSFLARRHGKDMVVLGFAFDQGRYNAVLPGTRLGDWEALPPPVNSVEAFLKTAGIPRFIVDLRRTPASGAGAWLRKTRPFRAIGSVTGRCSVLPTVVAEEYDGLVWIERSSPSVLLP